VTSRSALELRFASRYLCFAEVARDSVFEDSEKENEKQYEK
jgi:hypothetical protein